MEEALREEVERRTPAMAGSMELAVGLRVREGLVEVVEEVALERVRRVGAGWLGARTGML